jgi:hypothetical protein
LDVDGDAHMDVIAGQEFQTQGSGLRTAAFTASATLDLIAGSSAS